MEAKIMETKKASKKGKKSDLPIDAVSLNEAKRRQVEKSFENPTEEHQANSTLVNF